MNKKLFHLACLVLIAYFLIACGGGDSQSSSRPTRTPKPDRTERIIHFGLDINYSKRGDYLYRGFTQVLRGMALGPDGNIYVADWTGRHVLKIDMDGSISDLGLWKSPIRWTQQGPHFVAFDSEGILYVVSYGRILKVFPDGTTEDVVGHDTFIFGGIAINDQDQVFYADRSKGEVFTISPEGEMVLLASGLEDAEGMVFGLDGTLYVGQSRLNKVVQIDTATGKVEPFYSWDHYMATPYLAVDQDGDIWIRGSGVGGHLEPYQQGSLFQVSPDGVEKPFMVGGEEYGISRDLYTLRTPGGIAFDEEGRLWIASYSSQVFRLSGPVPGQKDSWTSLESIIPGLESRTMAVDDQNNVYVPNLHTSEIWKIDGEGNVEILLENTESDSMTIGPDGFLFLGRANEIIRLNNNQIKEHYVNIDPISMTFGTDGLLYVVSQDEQDGGYKVIRVNGVDSFEVITNEIADYVLGSGPYQHPDNLYVKIEPANDQGLYLYDPSYHALLYLDFNGTGHLVRELDPSNPAIRVAVAPDGTIYYLNNETYDIYATYPDGKSEMIAVDLYGDPEAMAVSPDGEWLFVAENGVIDKIRIR